MTKVRRVHMVLLLGVLAPSPAMAQDDAVAARVMARVRAAVAPALPFPSSDELGSLPADGKANDPWLVKPLQAGDRTIQVLANPLNEEHQRRATKAMAQIEASIEAAQRRADVQFERAVAEARRTGRSQDVDGVTLSDEGLAGARIDAESHVTIEVLFNQPSYRFEIASSLEPISSLGSRIGVPTAAAALVSVSPNVYRDAKSGGERFCEGEMLIYLGRIASPAIAQPDRPVYEVSASAGLPSSSAAISSIVIRMRGNELLMADLLRKSKWSSVLELIE
jgi:hypothetical protein